MKRLRWQILVVAVTLVIVALLLLSQQPVSVVTLPEAAPGGIYTEALVGSMGRMNPMLDWNNSADRDINRLLFSGLVKFDSARLAPARSGGFVGRIIRRHDLQFFHSAKCGLA
jgi:peptide/nickel transport system substrate-binding protein